MAGATTERDSVTVYYAPALLLSAIISAGLSRVAWMRRPAQGALGLSVYCAALSTWSLATGLQWVFTDRSPSFTWFVLRAIGATACPTALLVFALDFTNRRAWRIPKNLRLLVLEPVLMTLIVVTDPVHGLYLGGKVPDIRVVSGGPMLAFNILYAYTIMFAALWLLLRYLRQQQHRVFRVQAWLVLTAVTLPILVWSLEMANISLTPPINSTPFAFAASGLLLSYGLFGLGLLRAIPVARDRLVEELPEGVLVFDTARRLIDINPAARRMTDLTTEQLGLTLDEIFASETGGLSALREAFGATGTWVEMPRTEGGMRIIEASTSEVRDNDGAQVATLMTLRDVTERTSLTAQLEARREQLAALLERSAQVLSAMTDGVVLLDQECRLLRSNPSAERILGVPLERLHGEVIADAVPWLPLRKLTRDAYEAQAPISEVVQAEDGRSLVVEAVAMREAESRARQTLLVIRDETERLAAERVQRDFVANVSHELQTPLTGLSLLADTLPRALRDDPEAVEGFVDRLGNEIDRLTRMTNELMTLSRVDDASALGSHRCRLDFSRLVSEEATEIEPLAHAREQTLSFDVSPGIELTGDEMSLRSLVGNLLENAIRYTQIGGHIEVHLRAEKDDDSQEWAALAVSDNGVGISANDQERIFERFYRVDKARSRRTGGAGLGLSIVQHTAEQHGGRVDVDSTPGEGATFTVWLPLSK